MKFFFLLLLIAGFAHAGFIIGNGGNTVQCQWENSKDTFQLLDFFEAARLPSVLGTTLSFKNIESKTKKESLAAILAILQTIDTKEADLLQTWLQSFDSEAKFLAPGEELGLIEDSFHFAVPENCQVHQTAIQTKPIFREPRYFINTDLWNRFNDVDRAGLMMHELIYRYMGSSDSRPVRRVNAMIFSDQFAALTTEQQKAVLKKLKF